LEAVVSCQSDVVNEVGAELPQKVATCSMRTYLLLKLVLVSRMIRDRFKPKKKKKKTFRLAFILVVNVMDHLTRIK
jgi:hypothetical protein